MNNLFRGALAGIAATAPMTATMIYLHKHLPYEERFPLPPSNIAMKVAEDTRLRKNMDEKQKFFMTMFYHFSYGAVLVDVT